MVRIGLCLLALSAGCGDGDLTELVLSADSDLVLDQITFEVSADGVAPKTAQAARQGSGPSYVSIVRDHGTLGPLTVVARGSYQNRELVHRTHVVSFVPGESLLVPLDLYSRCVSAICLNSQTCGKDGCQAQALDDLPTWTGKAPAIEQSDAGQDDAGGLTMCGSDLVDLASDAENCGSCGHGCWLWENCAAGTCVLK
jgi:hypothetical protein